MSGIIRINYEAMNAQATQIKNTSTEISDLLNRVKNGLEQLRSEGFVTPSAAPKFDEAFMRYQQAQGQMNETLTSLGSWLDGAVQSAQALDQQLGSQIQ